MAAGKQPKLLDAGAPVPDVRLKLLSGGEASLREIAARGPALVAFFKISCPVCQFTFPFLQRLHERFAGNGVTVLGVSQDDVNSTKKFNHEYGVTFPTLVDSEGYPASNAYGLTNVPTIFLVAPDGKVKVSCLGFSKNDLEKIAVELSQHKKMQAAPFFRKDEVVPAYKPG